MNNMKKEKIRNLKNKYIFLRNYLLEYKNYLMNLEEQELEKQNTDVPVKTLTLTKNYYGKSLRVG